MKTPQVGGLLIAILKSFVSTGLRYDSDMRLIQIRVELNFEFRVGPVLLRRRERSAPQFIQAGTHPRRSLVPILTEQRPTVAGGLPSGCPRVLRNGVIATRIRK